MRLFFAVTLDIRLSSFINEIPRKQCKLLSPATDEAMIRRVGLITL